MDALSERQALIVALLSTARRDMRELTAACGCGADTTYVRVNLHRLRDRGYNVVNVNPAGSHKGGSYVLAGRPHSPAAERHCIDCDTVLSNSNDGDRCWSCSGVFERLSQARPMLRLPLPWPPPVTGARERVGA